MNLITRLLSGSRVRRRGRTPPFPTRIHDFAIKKRKNYVRYDCRRLVLFLNLYSSPILIHTTLENVPLTYLLTYSMEQSPS
jgi:hypothetical protein